MEECVLLSASVIKYKIKIYVAFVVIVDEHLNKKKIETFKNSIPTSAFDDDNK